MGATEEHGLLPVLVSPDPMLKAKARRVTGGDRTLLANLVPRMFATMYEAPGIGLAAPQVGVPLRLAVVDLAPDDQKAPLTLINPDIIARGSETVVREEGCLSIPGIYADVARPAHVSVRYEDLGGRKHVLDADGLLAACLQHEIDHLDGILFVDHLSALKRNMLMRRFAKERRQKMTA